MSGVCSSQRGESLLPPTGAGATISTNGGKPFTPATNHRTLQLCFHCTNPREKKWDFRAQFRDFPVISTDCNVHNVHCAL